MVSSLILRVFLLALYLSLIYINHFIILIFLKWFIHRGPERQLQGRLVINFVCVCDHLEASDRTVLSTFKLLLYIIYMDIGALLINFCIR